MKPRKAFDDDKIQEIRSLYQQGQSTYDIADQYFCCRNTVWEYVKDIKDRPKTNKSRLPDERVAQIKAARRIGVRCTELARILGVTKMTISRYARA